MRITERKLRRIIRETILKEVREDISDVVFKIDNLKRLDQQVNGDITKLMEMCVDQEFTSENDVENWVYRSSIPKLGQKVARSIERLGKLSWAIWTNGGRLGSGHQIEKNLRDNMSSNAFSDMFNAAENYLVR